MADFFVQRLDRVLCSKLCAMFSFEMEDWRVEKEIEETFGEVMRALTRDRGGGQREDEDAPHFFFFFQRLLLSLRL